MGHVYVEARISGRRQARVRFLVDTGATHTIIPPALVRRVGAPQLTERFAVELADGTSRRLRACALGVRLGGRSGPTTALVLPGGQPLLGAETLETLGLKVDPTRGRIERTRAAGALLVSVRRTGPD
jgi:aspartyl protease family protein